MPWPFSKRFRTSAEDREQARRFLVVLEWCSARQQLAMEQWNDALALEAGARLGDELYAAPPVALTAENAPQLLPVAERRLTIAQAINARFGSLEATVRDVEDGEWRVAFSLTIGEWTDVFALYASRCDATVQNLRSLIFGSPPSDEGDLALRESAATDRAIFLQREVMKACNINDGQLKEIMCEAFNDLRHEIGKSPLAKSDFAGLYASGMRGRRPRFFA